MCSLELAFGGGDNFFRSEGGNLCIPNLPIGTESLPDLKCNYYKAS